MGQEKPGALIKPKRNQKCLCGSQKKFGDCCAGHLPKDTLGRKYREAASKGNWNLALKLARADLTKYLIWYKSHTEPVLLSERNPPKQLEFLFEVDTDALGDLVDNIIGLHFRTGDCEKIPPLINYLNKTILLPDWHKKTNLMRVYYFLIGREDSERAFLELKRNFSNDEIKNSVELSQVFIDAGGNQLAHSERLSFSQNIIDNSDDYSDKIQYSALIASDQLISMQIDEAKNSIKQSLRFIESADENTEDIRFENFAANTLFLAGVILKERDHILGALTRFEHLQSQDGFSDRGKARLLRSIGDCNRHLERWKDSLDSFEASFELSDSLILKVFIAEAHKEMGSIEMAKRQLGEIYEVRTLLDPSELDDFAMHHTATALAAKDAEMIKLSIEIIESLTTSSVYFQMKIKDDLINLLKWQIDNPEKPIRNDKKDWLNTIILNPNIFGIGINLNYLISKLITKKE